MNQPVDPLTQTLSLLGAVVAGMLTQWLTAENRFKIRTREKAKSKDFDAALAHEEQKRKTD